MLPNLNVTTHSNSPDSLDLLSKAITLRMKEGLITDSACCRIAKASGGLMRTLIRLVQAAAVEAIVAGHESIAEEDVLAAEKKERAAFIPNLRQEDYQTLRRCHTEKRLLSADDAVLDLLYRRALLEYPNDEPWCDVNPVLLPTVLERTSDKELTRYGSLSR